MNLPSIHPFINVSIQLKCSISKFHAFPPKKRNFAGKFLVGRDGIPVKRYAKESWDDIAADLELVCNTDADAKL